MARNGMLHQPISAPPGRWRRRLLPLAWLLLAGSAQATSTFTLDVDFQLDPGQIDADGPGSWMSGPVAIPATTFDVKDTLQVNLHFTGGAALRLTDPTGLAQEAAVIFVNGTSLNGGTPNHLPSLHDFSFSLLGASGDISHNPVVGTGSSKGLGLLAATYNLVDGFTASSVTFTGVSFSFTVLRGADHFPNTSDVAAVTLFGAPSAFSIVAPPVPEPASAALALAGLLVLGRVAGRCRTAA